MNATTTIPMGSQTKRVATAGLLAVAVVLTATLAWAVVTFQGGSSTGRIDQGDSTVPTQSDTVSGYVEALADSADQLAAVWGRPVVPTESDTVSGYVEALADSADQLAAVWGNNVVPGSEVDLEALTRAIAETHERILAADQ